MNSSKKPAIIAIVVIVLVLIGIIWYTHSSSAPSSSSAPGASMTDTSDQTPVVPVSETTKVSNNLSEYKNDELGFSVKYPTAWEKQEISGGITFLIPNDSAQVSSIGNLQANIQLLSGKCAFPPITTIQDRGTLTVGADTLNMISITNTVQGRGYFNRMYSLQHGDLCYMFSFASITLPPSSKNLTGSNTTQAQNNNKALVTAADAQFTALVKTFTFTASAQGIDETKAPKK